MIKLTFGQACNSASQSAFLSLPRATLRGLWCTGASLEALKFQVILLGKKCKTSHPLTLVFPNPSRLHHHIHPWNNRHRPRTDPNCNLTPSYLGAHWQYSCGEMAHWPFFSGPLCKCNTAIFSTIGVVLHIYANSLESLFTKYHLLLSILACAHNNAAFAVTSFS